MDNLEERFLATSVQAANLTETAEKVEDDRNVEKVIEGPVNELAQEPGEFLENPSQEAFKKRISRQFNVLQKWQGEVQSVERAEKEFVAVTRDLEDESRSDENVTFSFDEVPKADWSLILPGAVFYWSVGYEQDEMGTVYGKSLVRFRRLPPWSDREIQRIKEEARRLKEYFGRKSGESGTERAL
ncbi:MAG TPA: hypothetical protein VEN81_17190 [Planctomycetota bacterium]|nr:hypothetical protein [Planctomycetota bacterium]